MFWRVLILVVLGIFNLALFSRMIWGPTGLVEYRELKKQYSELQQQSMALNAENMALSRDIRLLNSDGQYAEKMVRKKLHYLRDNEIVYLFAGSEHDPAGAGSDDRKN